MCPILILIITVLFLVRFLGMPICKWLFYAFLFFVLCIWIPVVFLFFFVIYLKSHFWLAFCLWKRSLKRRGNIVCSPDETQFSPNESNILRWTKIEIFRVFDVQESENLVKLLRKPRRNDIQTICTSTYFVVFFRVRHLSWDNISFQLRCKVDSRSVRY